MALTLLARLSTMQLGGIFIDQIKRDFFEPKRAIIFEISTKKLVDDIRRASRRVYTLKREVKYEKRA